MLRLTTFLLLFATAVAAGPLREEPGEGDIPRFSILNDGLYRGGQPTQKGLEFLKQKGVKTVINLRAEDNSEAKLVEKLGMNYVRIPVDEVRPWSQLPSAPKVFPSRMVTPSGLEICRSGLPITASSSSIIRLCVRT